MAIRYDKAYNQRLQKIVGTYNQTRKRLEKQGYKHLPHPVKVSSLKTRFKTRRELNKELTQLSKFSKKNLQPIKTSGGAYSTKWELQHLQKNADLAKNYYINRYRILYNRIGEFPGERRRLNEYEASFKALNVDSIEALTPDEFRAYRGAINSYFTAYDKMKGGYRGFLSQAEQIMRNVGISEQDIKKVITKLNTLTPEQFTKAYEEFDVINRIYNIADSPIYTGGELILNTSKEDALGAAQSLVDEIDMIVKQAKKETEVKFNPLDDLLESIISDDMLKPERTSVGKFKRSSMSPRQYYNFKLLGWDDLIDEDQ